MAQYVKRRTKLARLTIRRPDDFHVHLREGAMLQMTVDEHAWQFARALVMPNLQIPITEAAHVVAYRKAILDVARPGFEPLMTVKLHPIHAHNPQILVNALEAGAIAAKLYPEGVTTNSADGISDIKAMYPAFRAMESSSVVRGERAMLCIHAELPGSETKDAECDYIALIDDIVQTFPNLSIVVEHVSDARMVEAVRKWPSRVGATITPHHLRFTHDDVMGARLRPHRFCKPIPKWRADLQALWRVILEGDPKFFLGTDSAPHLRETKECADCCAGSFNAPTAMAMLIDDFDQRDAIDRLEPFVSQFGAEHYGRPLNESTITFVNEEWPVPALIGGVVPLFAGEVAHWRLA